MKTRQSKKGEYHELRIRIPVDLWRKVQNQSEAESKSYSATIIELLRNALKEK